jgi:thioredoxin-like negative regulator of GroEL
LDAAIELYRQLAQAAAALPDAARARVRAEAAAASDDARRAATLLAPIAEAHPGNLNARVRLAELWSAAGAHERARDIARSLVPLTAGALKRRVRSVLERVGRGQGSQPASPRSKRPPEHRRRDRPRRRASAR